MKALCALVLACGVTSMALTAPAFAAGAEVAPTAPALTRPDRNVFWPVGFDPAAKARTTEVKPPVPVVPQTPPPPPPPKPATDQDWVEAGKWLRIEGVSRNTAGKSVAIINGRVCQAGETLSLNFNGRTYRWTLKSIDDKGVDLSRLDEKPLEGVKK